MGKSLKLGKSRGFRGGAQGAILSSSGNGGIMGSGIFGMFGTTIRCEASDNSMYCSIMKFINLFFMISLIIFILWIVYKLIFLLSRSGRKR